ncbi:MAG TPA: TetR/AcrR family transcriptional regulator [Ktedonobacteraceae bacterium]
MSRKPAMPGVDRRQQILEAALAVFAERGFETATNKEITERAGVNQGLIYFYFESKADVFFAAFEYHARLVMAQLDAVFDDVRDENPATGFGRLLKQIVAVLDTPRTISLLRIMHQVMGSREPQGALRREEEQRSIGMLAEHLARGLRQYLEAHMARGTLRPVKVGLATYLITSTLISTIAGRRRDSRAAHFSQEELAEMIATLYGEGLLPRQECPNGQ